MPNVKQSAAISVCLSDIPKEKIFTADNGKKYATLDVVITDEVRSKTFDDGNTVEDQGWVSVYQTKEQRESGEEKAYVGKVKWANSPQQSNEPVPAGDMSDDSGDLPF